MVAAIANPADGLIGSAASFINKYLQQSDRYELYRA
jgi:hypothetical protein